MHSCSPEVTKILVFTTSREVSYCQNITIIFVCPVLSVSFSFFVLLVFILYLYFCISIVFCLSGEINIYYFILLLKNHVMVKWRLSRAFHNIAYFMQRPWNLLHSKWPCLTPVHEANCCRHLAGHGHAAKSTFSATTSFCDLGIVSLTHIIPIIANAFFCHIFNCFATLLCCVGLKAWS